MKQAIEKKELRVAPGEVFSISPGPSGVGGYVWNADVIPAGIEHVKAPEAQPSGGVGAGVQKHYRFRMLSAGRAKLVFSLKRPWEKTASRTMEFDISAEAK